MSYPRELKDLLVHDVTYPGWETETAQAKAFYVLGVTWFRTNVLAQVTAIGRYIPRMHEVISRRQEWQCGTVFNWDEPFSERQAHRSLAPSSREPLKFQKAVQTLVACEAAAEDRLGTDFSQDEFYRRMRIEAAVSYIHDFDELKLNKMRDRRPDFLTVLMQKTGQRGTSVFTDMVHDKKTVTHKLCLKVKEIIDRDFPSSGIGIVDFRFDPIHKARPSQNEFVPLAEMGNSPPADQDDDPLDKRIVG